MSNFIDANQNYGRDYGSGDWNQIKENFPRRSFGVKLVSIEDRVPNRPIVESRSARRHHRKRVAEAFLLSLAVLGACWLVSPGVFFLALGATLFAFLCALKFEGVF